MVALWWFAPLPEPRRLPERPEMNTPNSPLAMALGAAVIVGVVVFWVVFR